MEPFLLISHISRSRINPPFTAAGIGYADPVI
jgi:hypothetical protein